jgi:hypothetical protein
MKLGIALARVNTYPQADFYFVKCPDYMPAYTPDTRSRLVTPYTILDFLWAAMSYEPYSDRELSQFLLDFCIFHVAHHTGYYLCPA